MCEEFHCTPEEADLQDVGRCLNIIEMRTYRNARQILEDATSDTKLPDSPMIPKVIEAQIAIRVQGMEERAGDGS